MLNFILLPLFFFHFTPLIYNCYFFLSEKRQEVTLPPVSPACYATDNDFFLKKKIQIQSSVDFVGTVWRMSYTTPISIFRYKMQITVQTKIIVVRYLRMLKKISEEWTSSENILV